MAGLHTFKNGLTEHALENALVVACRGCLVPYDFCTKTDKNCAETIQEWADMTDRAGDTE